MSSQGNARKRVGLTRREFIKISLGVAASAAVSAARVAPATPAAQGGARWIATTCGECPAGCGLVARTLGGRPHELVGNPAHPLNRGGICARAQAALRDLDHPLRLDGPLRVTPGGGRASIAWEEAIQVVQGALGNYKAGQIAFLVGLFPDHLHDFLALLCAGLGGARLYRCCAAGQVGTSVTLMDASRRLFGLARSPYFDLANADLVFSFGASAPEPWLPPTVDRRGHWVYFGPRKPQQAPKSAEWVPTRIGGHAPLASALACLAGEHTQATAPMLHPQIDLHMAAEASGVPLAEMERLAGRFARAERKVALPGSLALGHSDGLVAAQAILALNALAGQPGGVYLPPDSPLDSLWPERPSTAAELAALASQIQRGQVKVLFVHGLDPLAALPSALGFEAALDELELLVSFAPRLDATAEKAHFVLPAPNRLESWGYQRALSSDRPALSAIQPLAAPHYAARAPIDVLLAAVRGLGGELARCLDYAGEVDFIQRSIAALRDQGGVYDTPDPGAFWELWLAQGGWWTAKATLLPPVLLVPPETLLSPEPPATWDQDQGYELHLLLYPCSGDGGQRDPLADSATDIIAHIHPSTARSLGLHDGRAIEISSPFGSLQAVARLFPAMRPDTLAVPLTGAPTLPNPLDLTGGRTNASGELAFASTLVRLAPG